MKNETYTCDVCHGIKGEGNRWLVGWVVRGGFALADWGYTPDDGGPVFHFCSEAHALAEQGKHLRQDRDAHGMPVKKNTVAAVRVIPLAGQSLAG